MQPTQITWPVSSTTAIAAAQTTTGTTPIVINGPYLQSSWLPANVIARMPDAFERKITLTSTGNLSAINFTIVGTTYNGAAVTEVLAGPNNNTVTSVQNYYQITSITPSGSVATAVSVGTGSTGVTPWIGATTYPSPISAGLYIAITATMSVTVEGTPDNPLPASPALFPHALLTAITSNDSSEWPYGFSFVRFKVVSSDATGAATFSVINAGV